MQREVNTSCHPDKHTRNSYALPISCAAHTWTTRQYMRPVDRLQLHFLLLSTVCAHGICNFSLKYYFFSYFQCSRCAAADAVPLPWNRLARCLWNWSWNCANNVRFSLKLFRWQRWLAGCKCVSVRKSKYVKICDSFAPSQPLHRSLTVAAALLFAFRLLWPVRCWLFIKFAFCMLQK